jgi:metal-responsive CopG/Arc/MetJ family transcriptional regulator
MTALSIHLPEALAKESLSAANELGISRTEFIRQAIAHELENLKARTEMQAMAASFTAMKKNKKYLQETTALYEDFNNNLPEDEDEWWRKK